MRMPDSNNKQTFPPSVTLQRCWFGSVGTVVVVDGDMVVVVVAVVIGAVVVDCVAVVFTLTKMMDALFNVLE